MDASDIRSDLIEVLYSADDIADRVAELARTIETDYAGRDLLLVGVLNGAVMVMADLSRALSRHCEMDWMAISSYGSGTQSSGVVRILKDLNTDLADRHVLVVEDIVDTGLTLAYLVQNEKLKTFYRSALFLPSTISLAVASIIFLWMYNPLAGPVSLILHYFGVESPRWFKEDGLVIFAIATIIG